MSETTTEAASPDTVTYETMARAAKALANVLGTGDGSYALAEPPAALTAMHDWLREHEDIGERDYIKTYREFWADIVEVNGRMDFDRVARELSDYRTAIDQVGRAYSDLTGGRLSKPNSDAGYVVQFAREQQDSDHAEHLRYLLDDTAHMTDIDELRAAIRERADELAPVDA